MKRLMHCLECMYQNYMKDKIEHVKVYALFFFFLQWVYFLFFYHWFLFVFVIGYFFFYPFHPHLWWLQKDRSIYVNKIKVSFFASKSWFFRIHYYFIVVDEMHSGILKKYNYYYVLPENVEWFPDLWDDFVENSFLIVKGIWYIFVFN